MISLESTKYQTEQNMHTHRESFYGSLDFVRDNPGEPVPEETFTLSHLLWSSIVPYLLHPSNMIHGILPVQFTCLQQSITQSLKCSDQFHNLSKLSLVYLLAWLSPLHTPYISSPNHCLLFATCFAIVPRLCLLILVSLSQPFSWNSIL